MSTGTWRLESVQRIPSTLPVMIIPTDPAPNHGGSASIEPPVRLGE